jgi:hypothetical protein
MHMSDEKFFSLAEANTLIPRLAIITKRMQRVHLRIRQEIKLLAINSDQCAHDLTIAQLLRLKPDLCPFFVELFQPVHDTEALGGSFKGLELGLVDSPRKIDGEIAELCWQYGEKEIAYDHSRDDEFAGRRPPKPVSAHL